MKILYHLTVPPPTFSGTDALVQEVDALRSHFGGALSYLYPFQRPGIRWPRQFYGFHQLPSLRKLDSSINLHHIFNADLYPYPILNFFKRPVIYSAVAGLQNQKSPPNQEWLSRIKKFVVTNSRDAKRLQEWGISNFQIIRPSIEVGRFSYSPMPAPSNEIILLAGSAPWASSHFHRKGVDLLLEAASRDSRIKLVFLWRGRLLKELLERVYRYGLEKRVEIINQKVDVNTVLARVHAALLLVDRPQIIKAYPHSLLEALATGKPVLLSECIPMADYVEEQSCGEVMREFEIKDLEKSIQNLFENYRFFQSNTRGIIQRDFTPGLMFESYFRVYTQGE